ncbi:MAG TPA: hypothetical protein VK942_20395 [Actinomycetes bacterium]|nr:hypothetical protein [Actinomycetes bacterium]
MSMVVGSENLSRLKSFSVTTFSAMVVAVAASVELARPHAEANSTNSNVAAAEAT